jgi:hypothetical protein
MSPSDFLFAVGTVLFLAAAFVIMYRALRLRSVLVDRPYRARALWTAIGGLAVVSLTAAFYLDIVFGQVPTTVEGVLVEAAAWGFTFLALYGWIASNINVAISADFFNRDPLRWKKGGGIVTIVVILVDYIAASLPSWWFPGITGSAAGLFFFDATFFAVVIYAIGVLAITYFRIQDRSVKQYTKWVVLSIPLLFLSILVPPELAPAAAFAWAYTMWRTVGSLAIRTRTLPAS